MTREERLKEQKARLKERNENVRKLFYDIQTKNAKWRIEEVIKEVAKKVFLAPRTVDAIISYEGTYNDNVQTQQSSQLNIF